MDPRAHHARASKSRRVTARTNQTANKDRFVKWLKTKLLPKLSRGE
jgi:hypothetical protein